MTARKKYKIGLTFGVFDLFHIGHLNLLKRAKALCDILVVCVSTDDLVLKTKGHLPVIGEKERQAIVASIRYVDFVDIQSERHDKRWAVKQWNPEVLIVGNDWSPATYGGEGLGVKVVYLPYTRKISSTRLRKQLGLC